MNKTVIFLMGKSGCGKSTLERGLVSCYPELYKKVISATTRPIRSGEKDGVDYHFYTDKEFDNLDLVQFTAFANNRYGSTVSEYTTSHPYPILCVVPSSAAEFTRILNERFPTYKTFNVYFDISDQRLRENMLARGDTEDMISKRFDKDDLDQQFAKSGLSADMVIKDQELSLDLPVRFHKRFISMQNAKEHY